METDCPTTNAPVGLNQSMQVSMDRFSMFKMLIKSTLEEISSGVSEEQYVHLFGQLSVLKSKSAPGKMQNKMKTHLFDFLTEEIDSMIEDENVERKMQNLDKLVDECAIYEGQETWRPNGDVSKHLRSHVMAVKLRKNKDLEENVREREQYTESLLQQVSALRVQIRTAEKKLLRMSDEAMDCAVVERIHDNTEQIRDLQKKREFESSLAFNKLCR